MTMLELFLKELLSSQVVHTDEEGNPYYQFIATDGRTISDSDMYELCSEAGIDVAFNENALLVLA